MPGPATVTFDYIETPLDVPMYVEIVQGDDDTNPLSFPITNGSQISFYLSPGIPQELRVVIGNRTPTVNSNALSSRGDYRSIKLDLRAVSIACLSESSIFGTTKGTFIELFLKASECFFFILL